MTGAAPSEERNPGDPTPATSTTLPPSSAAPDIDPTPFPPLSPPLTGRTGPGWWTRLDREVDRWVARLRWGVVGLGTVMVMALTWFATAAVRPHPLPTVVQGGLRRRVPRRDGRGFGTPS